MIKKLNIILSILAILVLSIFVYNKTQTNKSETIPNFQYYDLKTNKYFSKKNIIYNKKTVILYVSSHCGSCEKILQDINAFSASSNENIIIIISEESNDFARNFFKQFNFGNQVKLLNDSKNQFTSDFGLGISISYPLVFRYNENQKLIFLNNKL